MDAETDFRKTTVSHFISFAITTDNEELSPYVHFLWPGFIGIISGINKYG